MDVNADTDAGESPSLGSLLQTLPRELYDAIYHLTFAAEPGIHYVNKAPQGASEEGRQLRPLFTAPDSVKLLHVDRDSRAKFARSYYGGEGAVFICDHNDLVRCRLNSCRPWLRSLDTAHLPMLNDVRIVLAKCQANHREMLQWTRLRTQPEEVKHARLAIDFGKDVTLKFQTGSEDEVSHNRCESGTKL